MNWIARSVAVIVFAAVSTTQATSQETIKIADIEALSGPQASAGDLAVKHFQFIIDKVNQSGGVLGKKLELLVFDSKLNPQDSVIAAEKAIQQGARFITQGSGSLIAFAIQDFLNKHNARDPKQAALILNYASTDPDITDSKCSPWQFRFFANTDMTLTGLGKYLKSQPSVKKVYLINQDYGAGRAISRKAKEVLKLERPDIEIVGDEFHPLAKVQDFSPYVAKIKESGADSVITQNWGSDMTLLIKAAAAAGVKVNWYTYWGGFLGSPTAIGKDGVDRLKLIIDWHANVPSPEIEAFANEFKAKSKYDLTYFRAKVMIDMLVAAITKAGSAEAVPVAKALTGMRFNTPIGEWNMRAEDHQASHPIYIGTFKPGLKYDVENTGFGFATDAKIEPADIVTPLKCTVTDPK